MDKKKRIISRFIGKFKEDNVILLGASQAYYYLLSIFPLLIVCFAIIPYLNINPEGAINFLKDVLPREMASIFEKDILNLVNNPQISLLTIGIVGALWSTSNAIHALIITVNRAYNIEEKRSFLFVRFVALLLTVGMIIAFIFAMVLPVFGSMIVDFLKVYFEFDPTFEGLFRTLRWVFGLVFLTLFLIVLYRIAPNMKFPITHILPGALTASTLWQITSVGFYYYVNYVGTFSAIYGSIGALIILMIWFFLTGIILMIGAIINVLYYENVG